MVLLEIIMVGLLAVLLYLGVILAAMSGILGSTVRYVLGNNYKYDSGHDTKISSYLDGLESGDITVENFHQYYLKLSNGEEVWTANYPYACYSTENSKYRVSAKTFKRFTKWYKDTYKIMPMGIDCEQKGHN
jgi:hypothetical protein